MGQTALQIFVLWDMGQALMQSYFESFPAKEVLHIDCPISQTTKFYDKVCLKAS